MIATPSLSELATDTEDFEALSLIPSTQENNAVATRISREMAGLPHWIDTENYPTSIVSKRSPRTKILVNIPPLRTLP
jgi:hypothetical protein